MTAIPETSGALIGRHISVVVMGNTDRDHPIEDAIMDAAHLAGDRYGFDVTVGSGPYYYEGDETDRELAEVTAELDRLRTAHALLRIAVINIANNDGAWLPGGVHWRAMARTALAADVTAMGDPEGYALDIERWAMRAPKALDRDHA